MSFREEAARPTRFRSIVTSETSFTTKVCCGNGCTEPCSGAGPPGAGGTSAEPSFPDM
jgi:hypothetical protein